MRINTQISIIALRKDGKIIVPPGDYNLIGAFLEPDMIDGFLFLDQEIFIGNLLFDLLKKSKLIKTLDEQEVMMGKKGINNKRRKKKTRKMRRRNKKNTSRDRWNFWKNQKDTSRYR